MALYVEGVPWDSLPSMDRSWRFYAADGPDFSSDGLLQAHECKGVLPTLCPGCARSVGRVNSGRIPRRPYSRHGLHALKVRVKVRGLGAIDKRTSVARGLLAWRSELVVDLGGSDGVSAQKRALLDLACQTKLLLDSVDAWLLEQPTLINARRRAVLPVVLHRQQLADALARYLQALGLERRTPARPALVEYVANRYSRTAPVATASSARTPSGGLSAAGEGEDRGATARGRSSGVPSPSSGGTTRTWRGASGP
jgi:hypothetical protein